MTKKTNWYHYDNRGKHNNDYPYNQYDDKPTTINAQDIIDGKKEELKKIIPNNNYNPDFLTLFF